VSIDSDVNSPLAIALTLVGTGEVLLRLEKRVRCAAAALGVRVDISIAVAEQISELLLEGTPAILQGGRVAIRGLPRTEEIEAWLRMAYGLSQPN
jgi:hypothetical protein